MAHFANVNDDNIVTQVIVINNDNCHGGTFPDSEPYGQAYIASIGLPGRWLQCSYNSQFRGKYPGPNWVYDPDTDTFDAPAAPEDTTDERGN